MASIRKNVRIRSFCGLNRSRTFGESPPESPPPPPPLFPPPPPPPLPELVPLIEPLRRRFSSAALSIISAVPTFIRRVPLLRAGFCNMRATATCGLLRHSSFTTHHYSLITIHYSLFTVFCPRPSAGTAGAGKLSRPTS